MSYQAIGSDSSGVYRAMKKHGKKMITLLLSFAIGFGMLPAQFVRADSGVPRVSDLRTKGVGPMLWNAVKMGSGESNLGRVLKTMDWFHDNFVPFGYEYFTLDGWINNGTAHNENGYITTYHDNWLDASKSGVTDSTKPKTMTFADIAAYAHSIDVKFGMYYSPFWVLKSIANDKNNKIIGTNIPIFDICRPEDTVNGDPTFAGGYTDSHRWSFQDWYIIDPTKPGAKEYMQGMINYYKGIGVDFMKIDFIRYTEKALRAQYGGTVGYQAMLDSYEWWSQAAGPSFILAYANEESFNYMHGEALYADMVRISEDTAGRAWGHVSDAGRRGDIKPNFWDTTYNNFDGYNYFSSLSGKGNVILDGDIVYTPDLNDEEVKTSITLSVVAGGGIQIGDLMENNASTGTYGSRLHFFKNEEVIQLVKEGVIAKPLKLISPPLQSNKIVDTTDPKTQIWAGKADNGDLVLGIFNREDTPQVRTVNFSDLGLNGNFVVRDLWAKQNIGSMQGWSGTLPAHGSMLLRVSANGVTLNKSKTVLSINGGVAQDQLTATVITPAGTNTNVIWKSMDPSIATVDSNGLVKAAGAGKTFIRAEYADNTDVYAECEITVYDRNVIVNQINLNYTSATIYERNQLQLTAEVLPTAAQFRDVVWRSSDENVATVDQNGMVTGISPGNAMITVSSVDVPSVSAQSNITIERTGVFNVSSNRNVVSLLPTNTMNLSAKVVPNFIKNQAIIWSSDDPSVAKVDATGKVTAVASGITVVKATSEADPRVSMQFAVYVANEDYTFEAEDTKLTTLGSSAKFKTAAGYSGGGGVGTVGGSSTKWFSMKINVPNNVATPGLYNLGLYYAESTADTEGRVVFVDVNGVSTSGTNAYIVKGTKANNFNTPETEPLSMTVQLNPGDNIIKVYNNSANSPDFDKISLTKVFSMTHIVGRLDHVTSTGAGAIATVVSGNMKDLESSPVTAEIFKDGVLIPTDTPIYVDDTAMGAPNRSSGGSADGNGFVFARDYYVSVNKMDYPDPGTYTIVFSASLNGATQKSQPLFLFDVGKGYKEMISVDGIERKVVLGTTLQDVALPSTIEAKLDDGTKVMVPVVWDGGNPKYDGNTIGKYGFKGKLVMFEGIANLENVKASAEVTVEEQQPVQYTVTATAGANGTVSPATLMVNEGEDAVFTVTPDTGYKVDTVSAGTYDATAGTLTVSNVQADAAVTVSFKEISAVQYTITVTAGANGTVSPATLVVNEGEDAVFTVTPDTGYKVDTVSVGTYDATAGTLTVSNVQADAAVTVTFKEISTVQYIVTATAGANGTVSPATLVVNEGEDAVFTVTPDTGYKVDTVSAGTYDATAGTLIVSNVQADAAVTITFKEISAVQYTVTATAGANGTVSPATLVVNEGEDAVFTVRPDTGYKVDTVSAGTYDATAGTLTVSNVQADAAVTITFKLIHSNSGTVDSGNQGSAESTGNKSTITTVKNGNKVVVSGDFKATTDSAGKAAVAVTTTQVNEIIKALGSAEAGANTAVKLTLASDASTSEFDVKLPQTLLTQLLAAGSEEIQIVTSVGTVTFDKASINTINQSGNGDINISIAMVDTSILSENVKAAVGNRPVYHFTVQSGSTEISDFSGKVKVSIPYKPAHGEDGNAIVIYYIDKDGELNLVNVSGYDSASGMVNFVTTHFSSYAVGYNNIGFSDAAGSWAQGSITYLAARNIINGVGNGNFAPNEGVTRAQFAKMLAGILGADVSGYKDSRFSDVAADVWYAPYIEWAAANGIVSGTSNGKYEPNAPITREEMAVMITRFAKTARHTLPAKVQSPAFTDNGKISSWASEAVTAVKEAGIISGKPGNKFDPQTGATRAEAAKMLTELMQGMID